MCGICGIASTDDAGAQRELVERMSARLRHRGPDSDGLHAEPGVVLAARRLAIIDLEGGDQPIANEDGTIRVVQNGEIYNYPELREQALQAGHALRTRCDTEIHVHLYEEQGPRYVERLRGMFAVALWDARARRLVLARDRFGIKPLYYSVAGGTLAFASELKALLELPDVSRELDPDALEAYFDGGYVPAPLTIFRDARKLGQGELLLWDEGSPVPTVERYARPLPEPPRSESDEELAEELRRLLRDAVRAHLLSDVPVGVLLSGGVDSSALTALASELADEPVHTFSIGFEERSYDELGKARLVAQRFGTEHHELRLQPDIVDLFPAVVESFDEPFADDAAIPTYLVSQLAAADVKVALAGEGGDELFGGYDVYTAHALARVAAPAAPLLARVPSARAQRFARGAALPALERHLVWKRMFTPEARADLLRVRGDDPLGRYRSRWDESAHADDLARVFDLDVGTYLADELLVKADRASMAHSLEVRVPFLDTPLAAFALALPSRLKVSARGKKRLLRQALAPILPAEILSAPKHGFTLPASRWLRGELEPFARETLARDRGLLEPAVGLRLLDDHVARRHDRWKELWTLLSFCVWFDRYAG
ncbi:MAG TPA: asparagine synthase (glutamine-hydrolyzing) [Gaiellaceae bacterium]|nr:asparagine synthase (glutamine-hydrolyzing) [Gaiellaceae bacterium]